MEQIKKQVKWTKFVPWVIIGALVIAGYLAYKSQFVTITRHEYNQMKLQIEAQTGERKI